ncbi:MAG TPA: S8/S53 family peptidase [Anaerolineales bacterium]|nr:S8/S53 family peptidase [Anaerolineales bacterium]
MTKFYRDLVILALLITMGSCAAPAAKQPTQQSNAKSTLSPTAPPEPTILPDLAIVRHPAAADFSAYFPQITSTPKFDPASTDPFQVDLRSQDLTGIDMTASLADLLYATFDSKTQWPSSNEMPAGFDWQKFMETGKDPGLGLRSLHDDGFTGKGVGIAIIDQTLLVDHIEYRDQLQLYEEINVLPDSEAAMHGVAVTSIAVGKTVGVAPEADLYYIATGFCGAETFEELDFACWAKAVRRIVKINENLPADRKIRVLSMSWGWSTKSTGYKQISAAVNEAKAAGIFVISSSLGHTDELYFQGLGRLPLDDPNRFESYTPGLWWEKDYFADPLNYYFGNLPEPLLLVPMDSRTTASPTGAEDYVFYRIGGWSWSIPYLAGTYALAVQIDPDITPEEFWETALETGRTTQIQHDGREYEFGVILNPQALITAVRSQ